MKELIHFQHDKFGPPILSIFLLGTTVLIVVAATAIRLWLVLPIAFRQNSLGRNALFLHVGGRRFGPLYAQSLVCRGGPLAIGVRSQFHAHAWKFVQYSDDFVEFCGGLSCNVCRAYLKENGLDFNDGSDIGTYL